MGSVGKLVIASMTLGNFGVLREEWQTIRTKDGAFWH
jgi:hypothetical protein